MADEFDDILRFWFDRGVDGFRVDVAHGIDKDRRCGAYPMSLALTPSLSRVRWRGLLQAQALVDGSFVLADRRDGTFDVLRLIGATLAQWPAWIAGTGIGVVVRPDLAAVQRLGLDAVAPAVRTVLILAVATVGALLKAAGPLTVTRRAPAPAAERVTMLLPAALLTGLVVATVLGQRWAALTSPSSPA